MNARISITLRKTTQQLGTMYTHGISNRETVTTHIKGSSEGLSFGIHQPFGHETNGLMDY